MQFLSLSFPVSQRTFSSTLGLCILLMVGDQVSTHTEIRQFVDYAIETYGTHVTADSYLESRIKYLGG
jgi:hypothetical protein